MAYENQFRNFINWARKKFGKKNGVIPSWVFDSEQSPSQRNAPKYFRRRDSKNEQRN